MFYVFLKHFQMYVFKGCARMSPAFDDPWKYMGPLLWICDALHLYGQQTDTKIIL